VKITCGSHRLRLWSRFGTQFPLAGCASPSRTVFSPTTPLSEPEGGAASVSDSRIISLLDRCILRATDKLEGIEVGGPEDSRVNASGVAAREVDIGGAIIAVAPDSVRRTRSARGSRGVLLRSLPTKSPLSLLRITPRTAMFLRECEGVSLPTYCCNFRAVNHQVIRSIQHRHTSAVTEMA